MHIENKHPLIFVMLVLISTGMVTSPELARADGVRRVAVYPSNPHYLMDADGNPFLLIGFGDERINDVPILNALQGNVTYTRGYFSVFVRRHAWNRNWEDQPWAVVHGKVDMDVWNDRYWKEFRKRLKAAQDRNIVVGLTIWDGHTALPGGKAGGESFWNADRNVQGVQWAYDARALNRYPHPRKTGDAAERLVYYQRRIVNKLLLELAHFSNVVIELNNEEARNSSPQWWLWWARYFKRKGYVVAVNGASSGGISDAAFASDSAFDMKSYHARTDKTLTASRYGLNKIIVADADSHCTDLDPDTARQLAWKSVLRGGGWNDFVCAGEPFPNQKKLAYYGRLLRFFSSRRIPFWEMMPREDLSSSRYVLAKPPFYYLVYAETDVEVDLGGAAEPFHYEWFDPRKGSVVASGTIAGGSKRTFRIPSSPGGGWLRELVDKALISRKTKDYILWITEKKYGRSERTGPREHRPRPASAGE